MRDEQREGKPKKIKRIPERREMRNRRKEGRAMKVKRNLVGERTYKGKGQCRKMKKRKVNKEKRSKERK